MSNFISSATFGPAICIIQGIFNIDKTPKLM